MSCDFVARAIAAPLNFCDTEQSKTDGLRSAGLREANQRHLYSEIQLAAKLLLSYPAMFRIPKRSRFLLSVLFSTGLLFASSGTLVKPDAPVLQRYQLQIIGIVALCAIEILLIGAVIVNYARRKKTELSLSATLQFEALASALSARFIALPVGEIDAEIQASLQNIARCIGIDRINLREFSEDKTGLELRHCSTGQAMESDLKFLAKEIFPWSHKKMLAGEMICFSRVSDLPDEAATEKEAFTRLGVKSMVAVPLDVGGVMGAISFAALKAERTWSDESVRHLYSLAPIYANALKRKRVEDALQRSESLKTGILASLDSNIVVLDHAGTVIDLNEGWLRFGEGSGILQAAISVGANYFDVCKKAIRRDDMESQEALDGIRAVCRGSRSFFEREYECPSETAHSWYLISVTPLKKLEGGAVVEHKDITLRKRERGALRESEERFRVIADTSPVMIRMSDCSGRCTYFNQPWLEFTGQLIAEQLNEGWLRCVHPDDREQCVEIYQRAFHARERFRMEYRLRRYNGEYRWILDCGVPRYNPDHTFAGFIGSATDVNDNKKAEQTLRHLSGQLINAQEQERKHIARELHDDINQSLALLAIELEQLTASMPFEVSDRIRKTWKHALNISSDVQALSHRLHSSKLEYIGLLAAASSFCKEFSEQQQIEIEFTHSDVPADVPPDISLCIFRILQEALRNVVKHSRERYAEVDLCEREGELRLHVIDSGVGFDPGVVNGNNGLGLVSMRERLHLVGGHLQIQSRPNHGTELYVRVPMEKPAEKILPFKKAA